MNSSIIIGIAFIYTCVSNSGLCKTRKESLKDLNIEKVDTAYIVELCQRAYFDELVDSDNYYFYLNSLGLNPTKNSTENFESFFREIIIIERLDLIKEGIYLVDITFKATIYSTRFIVDGSLSQANVLCAGSGSEVCVSSKYRELLNIYDIDSTLWNKLYYYLIPLGMQSHVIVNEKNNFPQVLLCLNENSQYLLLKIEKNLMFYYYDTAIQNWKNYECCPINDHVSIRGISKYNSVPLWNQYW